MPSSTEKEALYNPREVVFHAECQETLENGMSQREACKDLNIHHKQYGVWRKQMEQLQRARNSKAKSLYQGRVSILKAVEDELLRFVFELREQGMSVLITMVIL